MLRIGVGLNTDDSTYREQLILPKGCKSGESDFVHTRRNKVYQSHQSKEVQYVFSRAFFQSGDVLVTGFFVVCKRNLVTKNLSLSIYPLPPLICTTLL